MQSDCFELELILKSRNNRPFVPIIQCSFVSFCYPCLSRGFPVLAPQMNADPTSRALEAWNGFSKILITPKPLIYPFSNFVLSLTDFSISHPGCRMITAADSSLNISEALGIFSVRSLSLSWESWGSARSWCGCWLRHSSGGIAFSLFRTFWRFSGGGKTSTIVDIFLCGLLDWGWLLIRCSGITCVVPINSFQGNIDCTLTKRGSDGNFRFLYYIVTMISREIVRLLSWTSANIWLALDSSGKISNEGYFVMTRTILSRYSTNWWFMDFILDIPWSCLSSFNSSPEQVPIFYRLSTVPKKYQAKAA